MITIYGRNTHGFCDGLSRRNFLRIGGMAVGGISLADVLRAETVAGTGSSHKAVINIHLGGGPSHQDMFDLKPNAPVEFRGEFNQVGPSEAKADLQVPFIQDATTNQVSAIAISAAGPDAIVPALPSAHVSASASRPKSQPAAIAEPKTPQVEVLWKW